MRHHFRLQGRGASYRSAWSVLVPGFESVWKHNILVIVLWHDPWYDIRSYQIQYVNVGVFIWWAAHTHTLCSKLLARVGRRFLQHLFWCARSNQFVGFGRKLWRGLGGDGLLWPLSCERPSRCRRSSCTVNGTADVSQKDHRDVWKREVKHIKTHPLHTWNFWPSWNRLKAVEGKSWYERCPKASANITCYDRCRWALCPLQGGEQILLAQWMQCWWHRTVEWPATNDVAIWQYGINI